MSKTTVTEEMKNAALGFRSEVDSVAQEDVDSWIVEQVLETLDDAVLEADSVDENTWDQLKDLVNDLLNEVGDWVGSGPRAVLEASFKDLVDVVEG